MDINDFRNSVVPFVNKAALACFPTGLRDIYVVGSLSSGEVTLIRDDSSDKIYASDIELIIDLSTSAFIIDRLRGVAEKLSKDMTNVLSSRGLKTHVSITTTSFALSRFIPFIKPNTVYLYELRRVLLGSGDYSVSSSYLPVEPSKLDSLNLIFSSIADYMFAKLNLFKDLTTNEKCYIHAKRCLTLLYSLMLFNGVHPRSYAERVTLAKKHFDKLCEVISGDDIRILEALTKYKLSGNSVILTQRLPLNLKTIYKLLEFLDQYFQELATKTLVYELAGYICDDEKLKPNERPDDLRVLLSEYRSKIRLPLHERIMYLTTHMILTVLRPKATAWKKLQAISHSVIAQGLKIEDLLRYLISLEFLLMVNAKTKHKPESVNGIKQMWDSFLM